MTNERMKILEMVSEGKLTVDEAAQLLKSIAGSEEGPEGVERTLEKIEKNLSQAEAETESSQVQPEMVEEFIEPRKPVEPATPSEQGLSTQKTVSIESAVPGQAEFPDPEEPERSLWDWIKQFISWLGPKEEYSEELDWAYESASVTAITAQTTNGSIKFAGSERDQVLIYARKVVKAPSLAVAKDFAQQVLIHVEQDGDHLQIYKQHPKPPIGVEVSVSYRLQSPPIVDLRLQTTNGSVQVEDAEGAVEARSTNGKIRLDGVTGHIQAQTTNGGIAAKLARLRKASDFATTNGSIEVNIREGVAPLAATTTNGSINLTLPADFSGQLDARTTNGRVRTEFQVLMTEQGRNHLVGQLGAGGDTPIKLRTVNGSIQLGVLKGDPA